MTYTFVPALRHGSNEQEALQELDTALTGSSSSQISVNKVKPLIEIVDEDDLNDLRHYTSRYPEVFVDLPQYLTKRDSKHKEDVVDLCSKYSNDPVTFHTRNSGHDYTPVISGPIDPFDYSPYESYIQELTQKFDRLCIRLFIPTDPFNSAEETEIERIINACRPEDALLLDVLDIAELSQAIRPNIEYVRSLVSGQDIYVFDLFEPRGEVNYNYGLVMGKHTSVDGVGDFVIEPRFPQDIPGAAFQNIPRRIRQYDDGMHSVSTWEDADHYVKAIDNMTASSGLNPNHCPFCESLHDEYQHVKSSSNRKDIDASFVKRMRMNHYMYSVLQDEFSSMDAAPDAQQFDPNGYNDIV